MSSSSLEDRVHDLCAQAVAAKNQAELDIILPKLRAAIRDHVRYFRAIALETIPEAFGSSTDRRAAGDTDSDPRPESNDPDSNAA